MTIAIQFKRPRWKTAAIITLYAGITCSQIGGLYAFVHLIRWILWEA